MALPQAGASVRVDKRAGVSFQAEVGGEAVVADDRGVQGTYQPWLVRGAQVTGVDSTAVLQQALEPCQGEVVLA
jgi:hypothetical protein